MENGQRSGILCIFLSEVKFYINMILTLFIFGFLLLSNFSFTAQSGQKLFTKVHRTSSLKKYLVCSLIKQRLKVNFWEDDNDNEFEFCSTTFGKFSEICFRFEEKKIFFSWIWKDCIFLIFFQHVNQILFRQSLKLCDPKSPTAAMLHKVIKTWKKSRI